MTDFTSENNSTQLSLDFGNEQEPSVRILFDSANYEILLVPTDIPAINQINPPGEEAYQVRNKNTQVIEVRTNAYPAALEVLFKLEQATKTWLHEIASLTAKLKEATSPKVTPIGEKKTH